MIKLQNYTPHVYYNQSRDFQLIGRLYDLLFNAVKTATDQLYNLPFNDNTDSQLIDLLAMTLGFKARHHYQTNQLVAICSIFPQILRNKGTLTAIELAGRALLNSEGITDTFSYTVNDEGITIFLPETLSDTMLFTDLLTYILPAGMTCEVIRVTQVNTSATTELGFSDALKLKLVNAGANQLKPNSDINIDGHDIKGIAAPTGEPKDNDAVIFNNLILNQANQTATQPTDYVDDPSKADFIIEDEETTSTSTATTEETNNE